MAQIALLFTKMLLSQPIKTEPIVNFQRNGKEGKGTKTDLQLNIYSKVDSK